MLTQTEDNCQLFSSGEVYNTSIRQAAPGAVEFLISLFSNCQNGYINIRCFPSKNNLFLSQTDLQDLLPYFLESNRDQDAFFAVATRRRNNGTKDGVVEIPAIWCDIDFKNVLENEARDRIKNFPLQPTFEINSGGGLHPYFKLKEPASKEDIPKVENILKRLASYFHGDMNATDASRILRLPGSINHKYAHQPVVAIKRFCSSEYDLEDFDQILPELEKDTVLAPPTLPEMVLPQIKGTNAETLLDEALKVAYPGIRNSTGFQLACKLRNLELTKDEAFPFMIRYAKGKYAKEGGHPYTRKEALASLYQAYNGKKGTPVLSLPIKRLFENLWGENGQPSHTCKRLKSRTDLIINENTGKGWLQSYYDDEWNCPGCAWYMGKRIAMDLGFNFPDGFHYMTIPLQDETRYETLKKRVIRAKGAGCGIVSFAVGTVLITSSVKIDDEMKFVNWGDTDTMKDILTKFLSCEPEPIKGAHKIRPFGTFLRRGKSKADDENWTLVRIPASPEQTIMSLLKLDCVIDGEDGFGKTSVKLSELARKFFRSIVTGDLSKIFMLPLPFDDPIWRARVLRKRKLE